MKRLWWLAVGPCGLALGFAAVVVAGRHGGHTTYTGASGLATVAELAAGWSLVAVGWLLSARAGSRRAGVVVALAGVAWFASDWAGWEDGPAAIRTVGFLAGGAAFALALDGVVSSTAGGGAARAGRALILAVYAETILVALGRALSRDPFDDPRCWSDCTSSNVFLVHHARGLARALDFVDLRFAIASGAALAALSLWRLAAAGRPARRRLWPLLIALAAFGTAFATRAAALLGDRVEDPHDTLLGALFVARCLAAIGLAAGLAWRLVLMRQTRTAVARIAGELSKTPSPGWLEAAMARAIGDSSLSIAYWLPGARRYVDRDGHPVETLPRNGRASTAIVRDGEPVALVTHDPAVLDGPALLREIGAAARMAVDNERLQAEARAQLVELRASRARIVETADMERRGLERDLHDGAQQRLLALSYDIRLARSAAERDGEASAADGLDSALAQTQRAIDDLRELAHGIFPAILEEGGLARALETLADTAPLPVELGTLPHERLPAAVARAAYATVAEAIEDAAARQATFLSAEVVIASGRVGVTVHDDGGPRRSGLVHLADRVGALNGSLDLSPGGLRVEIPCA
jgi:signal transduction histidine kinase